MIWSFVLAVILLGLPVALLSYFLVRWAIAGGHLGTFGNRHDFSKKMATMQKAQKARKKEKDHNKTRESNLIARKWVDFGGGFYGLMALFTYILIEIGEIATFIRGLTDLEALLSNLGLHLIISFIVNSILNLIQALVWFITLQSVYEPSVPWLWLLVAYGAYLLGARLGRDYPTFDHLFKGAKATPKETDTDASPAGAAGKPVEE